MTVRVRRDATALGLVTALVVVLASCGSGPAEPGAPVAPTSSTGTTATASPTATARPTPTSVEPRTASPTSTPTPTPSRSPSSSPSPEVPLVVIDPGHSGRSIRSVDARTGLRDIDYPNYPEIYEMFDVSVCVGKGLRADGYRVLLTKDKALDSVGLGARARLADDARAALAISVHDDHSQGPGFQATYSQRGVRHDGAYHAMYRGSGRSRTVFSDGAVARASEKAAATIARERSTVLGRPVGVRENVYTGRSPLEPGNLAIVQLLATVPWVYNEAGAALGGSTTRAMSIATEQAYAKGLLLGVEAAVPLPAGRVPQPSAGARQLRGCLVTAARPGDGRAARPARYRPSS